MVKQIKLKMSSSTYLIPYDDELYFVNLEEDIENNFINVSKNDVDNFWRLSSWLSREVERSTIPFGIGYFPLYNFPLVAEKENSSEFGALI